MQLRSLSSLLFLAFALGGCAADEMVPIDHGPDVVPAETAMPEGEAMAPVAVDLAPRLAAAERVVHGRVARLAYRVGADGPLAGAPRTLVTVDVMTALKGPRAGAPLTLEFLGGALPDGRYAAADDVPLFDVGDEVILLVDDDLTAGVCPLVGCEDGVLRLSAGAVYDEGGHALFLDGATLRRGDRALTAETAEFHIGAHVVRREAYASTDTLAHARVASRPAVERASFLTWLSGQLP